MNKRNFTVISVNGNPFVDLNDIYNMVNDRISENNVLKEEYENPEYYEVVSMVLSNIRKNLDEMDKSFKLDLAENP